MSLRGMLRERMDVLAESAKRAGDGSLRRNLWVVRRANIPCDIQPLTSSHKIELGHKEIAASHQVYFQHTSIELQQGDRIRINGRQYDVVTVEFGRRRNWPSVAMVDQVSNDPGEVVAA